MSVTFVNNVEINTDEDTSLDIKIDGLGFAVVNVLAGERDERDTVDVPSDHDPIVMTGVYEGKFRHFYVIGLSNAAVTNIDSVNINVFELAKCNQPVEEPRFYSPHKLARVENFCKLSAWESLRP